MHTSSAVFQSNLSSTAIYVDRPGPLLQRCGCSLENARGSGGCVRLTGATSNNCTTRTNADMGDDTPPIDRT
jgi:hypothetical protein